MIGEQIPAVVDEITARRVVQNPGATGDYFPGHWDPDYARRQGQRAIYANSLHIFGLLDRAVTEWAGPTSFLVRRNVRLVSSMYAGDTVTVAGVVADQSEDGQVVELELTLTNQDGNVICTARSTVRLMRMPGSRHTFEMGEDRESTGEPPSEDERRRNDRREGQDRRKKDLGPPEGAERRKSERRSGRDRRHS